MSTRRRILLYSKADDRVYEYVDLGLPSGLLWATCNIGAENPEDFGEYFSWANVKGHKIGETYSFDTTTYSATPGSQLQTDIPVNDTYDAARKNCGLWYRMPTPGEWTELKNNCTLTWSTLNGVSGYTFSSTVNGESMFLPANGAWENTYVHYSNDAGRYWNMNYRSSSEAPGVNFNSSYFNVETYYGRSAGFSIRGVIELHTENKKGAFIYNINGELYAPDEWSYYLNKGLVSNDDVVGIAVITDEHKVLIGLEQQNKMVIYTANQGAGCEAITDSSIALQDYDGKENSDCMLASYGRATNMAFGWCHSVIFKNGNVGYLPALGEINEANKYYTLVEKCASACSAASFGRTYYYSSTYQGKSGAYYNLWGLIWGSGYVAAPHIYTGGIDSGAYLKRPYTHFEQTNGAYVIDTNNKLYGAYQWRKALSEGSVTNNDAVGIMVASSGHRFILSLEEYGQSLPIYSDNSLGCNLTAYDTQSSAKTDYTGFINTKAMAHTYGNSDSYAQGAALSYEFTNGKHGYIPSVGELLIIWDFKDAINDCLSACSATALNETDLMQSSTYCGIYNNNQAFWSVNLSNASLSYTSLNASGRKLRFVCEAEQIISNGVYACDSNLRCYTLEEVSYAKSSGAMVNTDFIGVGLKTDKMSVVIDRYAAYNGNIPMYGGYNIDLSGTGIAITNNASTDFNGEENTTALINALSGVTDGAGIVGCPAAESCRQMFNGKGYLPSAGELYEAYKNKTDVETMMTNIGGTKITAAHNWTSTQANAKTSAHRLRWTDAYFSTMTRNTRSAGYVHAFMKLNK